MMHGRRTSAGAAVAALLVAGACGDGATDPSQGLDLEDAAFVALQTDELAGAIVFDLVGVGPVLRGAGGREGEFERSRDCPDGGTITLAGESTRTEHGDGAVEWTLEATGEWNDCTRSRTSGDRSLTTVIDGSFQLEASRRHNGRVPVGDQTMSKSGSFHWTRTTGAETREGDCSFEVTSVRNPDSRRIVVTGTVCGREIDRTVMWRQGM
jgi:hypothetical protein